MESSAIHGLQGKAQQQAQQEGSGNKTAKAHTRNTEELSKNDQAHSQPEQSPPGFEGPPRYKRPNRASVRLQGKNGGRYISVVDKARANRGFISIAGLMQKVKAKKANRASKPSPEYLKKFEPLTKEHAQALLATARVEEDSGLQAQIDEAVANQGGNALPITAN